MKLAAKIIAGIGLPVSLWGIIGVSNCSGLDCVAFQMILIIGVVLFLLGIALYFKKPVPSSEIQTNNIADNDPSRESPGKVSTSLFQHSLNIVIMLAVAILAMFLLVMLGIL